MMLDRNCGEIQVCDGKKPVGAVTDRDITVRTIAQGKNPMKMTTGDCMTSPCITFREEADLEQCLSLMGEHHLGSIAVVKDPGACTEVVSQADIARKHVSRDDSGANAGNFIRLAPP